MMDLGEVEYVVEDSMWFIKYRHVITGGRYDSQETAQYAAETLTVDDMDILWMDKVIKNPSKKGSEVLISRQDIDEFLSTRPVYSKSE